MLKKTISIVLVIILCITPFCFAENEIQDNNSSTNTVNNENNQGLDNTANSNEVRPLTLKEQQDKVQEELEKATTQLTYVENELSKDVVEISKMEDELASYEEELNKINEQYRAIQTKVQNAEKELEKVQNNFQTNYNVCIDVNLITATLTVDLDASEYAQSIENSPDEKGDVSTGEDEGVESEVEFVEQDYKKMTKEVAKSGCKW